MNKTLPIAGKNNILVACHAFADPDALGSLLALGSFLKKNGVNATLFAYGGVPSNLQFLVDAFTIRTEREGLNISNYDLIIVVDSGVFSLTRLPKAPAGVEVVNIDHHPDNAKFGTVNMVDPSYAATCELIYDIFKSLGHRPDGFEATALLAGIMGDTGSFRHSNTTPRVLTAASELLSCGAKLSQISKNLFTGKTSDQLKAWSYVLEHTHFDAKARAVISAITAEDIEFLGVDDEAFEGIVEILNTFPGADYAAFLRQRGPEIKVSLRSENYKNTNVQELAKKFGGGGHDVAAGFTIPGKLVREDELVYILPE